MWVGIGGCRGNARACRQIDAMSSSSSKGRSGKPVEFAPSSALSRQLRPASGSMHGRLGADSDRTRPSPNSLSSSSDSSVRAPGATAWSKAEPSADCASKYAVAPLMCGCAASRTQPPTASTTNWIGRFPRRFFRNIFRRCLSITPIPRPPSACEWRCGAR